MPASATGMLGTAVDFVLTRRAVRVKLDGTDGGVDFHEAPLVMVRLLSVRSLAVPNVERRQAERTEARELS